MSKRIITYVPKDDVDDGETTVLDSDLLEDVLESEVDEE